MKSGVAYFISDADHSGVIFFAYPVCCSSVGTRKWNWNRHQYQYHECVRNDILTILPNVNEMSELFSPKFPPFEIWNENSTKQREKRNGTERIEKTQGKSFVWFRIFHWHRYQLIKANVSITLKNAKCKYWTE